MARRAQDLYDRLPIAAQELLVSAAGWNTFRNRFGAPFRRILDELERSDFRTADELRDDQERRLQETVSAAARDVPYYRDLFRREGIDPASIRNLDDLARIPPLEKKTVHESHHQLRSEAVSDRRAIASHSSGTTGTALPLFHTRKALGWEYGVIWRQRGWFGVRLREKFSVFGGQQVVPIHQKKPPFWRYDRFMARMIFSLYHMTPRNLRYYCEELRSPDYRFWQGYPSSIGLIAQYMLDHDVELGPAAPVAVFTSSETLLEFHRDRIEKATGAPVADRYGNAEFCVSALQCPDGGYHVDTEFCILEVDPHERGDGWVRGEVLATGFANPAMPFIRYRTGDVATLLEGATCRCGRARPLIERVDGRIEDYVITPDGRRVGRMDHVFKDTLDIKEAQIFQPTHQRIVVRIVPRESYGPSAERQLERELRSRLGDDIEIAYELRTALPREANGKFRAVVSALREARLR